MDREGPLAQPHEAAVLEGPMNRPLCFGVPDGEVCPCGYERGIPIEFNTPFGEKTFKLVTKNEDGTFGTLYCTDYFAACSPRFGTFDDWTGKHVITIGLSDVETETMKHLLKIVYCVDRNYKRPYDNNTYVRLIKVSKYLKLFSTYLDLTNYIMQTKNLIVACQLEMDNDYYCEMLKEMHICEIVNAFKLLNTEMKHAKVFNGESIYIVMQKMQKDSEPPFHPCIRCGAIVHTIDWH